MKRIAVPGRTQIILALALMLVGFGVVMQLRTYERLRERLEAESEQNLVEIVDRLDGEIKDTRAALLESRIQLQQYRDKRAGNQEILAQAEAQIAELSRLTGKAAAAGSGIVIDIENENRLLIGLDVRQIIEELRVSGAWAIAVNGRRIDHRSSLWRRAGYIYLDGVKLKPELKIEALGPRKLLRETMTLPNGIRDQLQSLEGVRVAIKEEPKLRLDRVKAKRPYRFAERLDKTIKQ